MHREIPLIYNGQIKLNEETFGNTVLYRFSVEYMGHYSSEERGINTIILMKILQLQHAKIKLLLPRSNSHNTGYEQL